MKMQKIVIEEVPKGQRRSGRYLLKKGTA